MNNNSVTPFHFKDYEVGTINRDGEPWFVARDICGVLELSDVSMACQNLDDDEKLIQTLLVSGQGRPLTLISESGLYTLIFRSNKPQAKPFRRWVTHEVLPAIRKNGSYEISPQVFLPGQLSPDLLQELGYASRNAAMIVRSYGFSYNRPLARQLINYIVVESTGYDLLGMIESTGLLPDDYSSGNNSPVVRFVAEECHLGPEEKVVKNQLFEEYQYWCECNELRSLNRVHFFRTLRREVNISISSRKKVDKVRVRFLLGISLKKEVVA